MATRERAWMSWSSGKDSAMALELARAEPGLEVTALLCTVNADADRVAMHAVRRSLLETQARRLGLPLVTVEIPSSCPEALYEDRMAAAIATAQAEGVRYVIFGDLFLRDVRAYREGRLAGTGISPMFPLWDSETGALARQMLAWGVKAIVTCVDPTKLGAEFAGRHFDDEMLDLLPAGVDPCGENGEFHTFVWDGPGFAAPIDLEVGKVVERDGFIFCDLSETGPPTAPLH